MGESHKWRLRYKDLKSLRFVAPPRNVIATESIFSFYLYSIL